jgi:glutathione peroxidase
MNRDAAMIRRHVMRFTNLVACLCAALIMETMMARTALAAEVTAHDFTFESIDGGPLRLADYADRPILLVNTASMCGFTPQYESLQSLWAEYRDRGLVVLGVPSDDFGGQEYDSSAEIKQFCEINYGIDFPMTEKVAVKGDDAHPYYRWVGTQGRLMVPKWNFHKHLIDGEGRIVDWFASTTAPDSRKVIAAIEKQLGR